METKEVFQKACLLQLSTSVWTSSRMLEQAIMERIGTNADWLRGRKFLINPELLGPINTTTHQARSLVQKHALPFPITSIYLVPKESLALIDERLGEFKERFWIKVAEFEQMYEAARDEAKSVLKDLFNEADYPGDISSKFKFEWRFLVLDVPGKSKILSPQIYEREKQKFEALMAETRELALMTLREEFGGIVKHLVEQLTTEGKPKTLKTGMFNRLREFLDDFGTKNIFEDETLKTLTEQAKSAIGGMSAYGLRYNSAMQQQISHEMQNLKTAIDEAIEELPRRKLRMAV
jgi:hypothetical protein